MRLTLLILILFKSVIAEDDSDEKYIDNLPEDEKREFLEKIARRILEDYQNINVPKAPSVDITDEALNTHTAYVQNIVKEERNKTNKAIIRRDNNYYTTKREEIERENSEHENFLDLTMRASKREKRKDIQNENHTNNDVLIPVVPLYDNMDISQPQKHHVPLSQSTLETVTDNYEKSSKSLKPYFVYDDSEHSDERKSTVNNQNFERDLSDTYQKSSVENVENESQNLNENITYKEISITSRTTDHEINFRKNNDVEETMLPNQIDNETIELKSVENSSKLNGSLDLDTNKTIMKKSSETTFKPDSFTFNEQILDTINDNPKLIRNKTVLDGYISPETNTNNSVEKLTSSITHEDLYTTTDAAVAVAVENTSDIIKKHNTTVTASTRNTSLDVNNIEQVIKSKVNVSYRARKTYPQQRIEEDRTFTKTSKIYQRNGKLTKNNENGSSENKPNYYVYEVSAERPPFVAMKTHKDENPHYARVYNYSPENAYYNPYNHFGPNEIDLDFSQNQEQLRNAKISIKDSKRSRFQNINSGYYNPYKFSLFHVLKRKNPYNILHPQPVIPNNDNYNPNDYIDMDYFFGRNENYMRKGKLHTNTLPDTNESDHPYTNFQEGKTMNYMDAVRNILYANKMFGYVPSVYEKQQSKTLRENLHDKLDTSYNKDKDSISMDYYFGRKNSDEEMDELNFHNYQQFHPITPTPTKHKKTNTSHLINVESTLNVLQDLIKMDNEALTDYDWLRTAVDVQSALEKLYHLAERLKAGEHLHSYDLELLKYAIYLYKSSNLVSNDTISLTSLQTTLNELRKNRKKKSLMPKIKKKKKGFKSAVKMWRDFATFLRSLMRSKTELLNQFQKLILKMQFFLNDLHDAIKHVAMVTTYNTQNWYIDLKNLYFQQANRRKLLTILLHLSTSRLFGLIEDTKDILEDSFLRFVKNNKKEVDKARNECMYSLQLLSELRKMN